MPHEDFRPATVYYDGACPLCRAEIDHYRRCDGAGAIAFVDVSAPGPALPDGLTREAALARFHVLGPDGRLRSGARAFASLWRLLPAWRRLGRLTGLPGIVHLMEAGYRATLVVRPALARLFAALRRPEAERRS